MESLPIVVLREEYLDKITKYRELKRHIVYLDETWFDTNAHDTVQYGWVDQSQKSSLNAPCLRVKQCTADYHEDVTADLYEKWFLANIPPNSVLVMDNAFYHSRILNKIPNSSSRKTDILEYL